ncbi:hypothetical protein MD484_g1345, partial [Candolleomyces efflorescens]
MKFTSVNVALVASVLVLPALAAPVSVDSQINETRDLSNAVDSGLEMRDVSPASMYSRELDDAMIEDILARMFEEHGLDARDLAELQEREPFLFFSKIFKVARKVGGAIHSAVQNRKNRKNKREFLEDSEIEEIIARELASSDVDLQERDPFLFFSKIFKIGRKVGGAIHSAVQNRKNRKRDLGDDEMEELFSRDLDFDLLERMAQEEEAQMTLARRGVELLDELD